MAGAAPASAFTLYTPPGSDLTATAFSGPSSWEINLVLEFELNIDLPELPVAARPSRTDA